MKKVCFIVFFVCTLVACSNPRDLVIPEFQSIEEMHEFGKNFKEDEFTEEEQELLGEYVLGIDKNMQRYERVPGLTINQAIDLQRQRRQENIDKLQAQQLIKEQQKMQELQDKNAFYNSIQLGEVSRELLENNGQNFDYSTYVATYVEFVNTSDKVITGIKGAVIFKNNFGDILYSLNVAEDNISLAPHGSYIYSHKRDSIFADERYINADLSDLQIVFQGEQLLFDDGTKLVLEQAIW